MIPTQQSDFARLITPTMLVLFLVLATVPLWIARAGLYPYLGIEILIWSLYALAFNLVLGQPDCVVLYGPISAGASRSPLSVSMSSQSLDMSGAAFVLGVAGALVACSSRTRRASTCLMTIVSAIYSGRSRQVAQGHRRRGRVVENRRCGRSWVASFDLAGNVGSTIRSHRLRPGVSHCGGWYIALWPRDRGHQADRTRAAHLGYMSAFFFKASISRCRRRFGCRWVVRDGAAFGLFRCDEAASSDTSFMRRGRGAAVSGPVVGGSVPDRARRDRRHETLDAYSVSVIAVLLFVRGRSAPFCSVAKRSCILCGTGRLRAASVVRRWARR